MFQLLQYILIYIYWLIEILVMVYSNPYTTGWYNPLYNLTNQVFFISHIIHLIKSWIFLGLTAKEGEKKLFGEVVWWTLLCSTVLFISPRGGFSTCLSFLFIHFFKTSQLLLSLIKDLELQSFVKEPSKKPTSSSTVRWHLLSLFHRQWGEYRRWILRVILTGR